MSTRPWMPLYVGDFLADTQDLSATETGIYIRLLMHCWQHGSIPRDPHRLALIAHCDSRLWHQYGKRILLFFDVVDASTAQHKRVSKELLRMAEISNKRKGAAEQMLSKRAAKAEQLLTHSHSHLQEEKKEERKKDSPPLEEAAGLVSKYFFESGVIRLSEKNFRQWEEAFKNINLRAELIAMTEWAGQQEKWFYAVSNLLRKRDLGVIERREQAKAAALNGNGVERKGGCYDKNGHYWASGIEGVT